MALNTNKDTKLYYSIKEVASMVGVSESTLRYWETEFPTIKPKTVPTTKVRQYTTREISLIRTIHSLIKVRGFKIAAARKYLRERGDEADRQARVLDALTAVRTELRALKAELDALQ